MKIRWVKAFRGGNYRLQEALVWEATQSERKTLAAELIPNGEPSRVDSKVGLLVANSAVIKKFKGDVFSEYKGRRLVKTRSEYSRMQTHRECWVRPVYKAVVVKTGINPTARAIAEGFSAEHNLPLLLMDRAGTLHKGGGRE